MDDLEERVRSLVEPVLARHGAELIEVQVRLGRTRLVRVIADHPDGIGLDTCAAVSAELSRMLDADDPIRGRYTLEVTSPGVDRPLRTEKDFRRNLGRRIRLRTAAGEHLGTIEEVGADSVTIRGEAEPIEVRLAEVQSAKVQLPW